MREKIPQFVRSIMDEMLCAGHEVYCVGGCVRDLLMGKTPHDWDLTTSARPEETAAVFGSRAIPTGLQHGTVTVLGEGGKAEITTYRVDGEYLDHRHPLQVQFSAELREDLCRRDFTVNAMAMSIDGAVTDLFGGREDLAAGVIRCVGKAEERFEEDALRIMRGLRFASVLGFSVEEETAQAMRQKKELLCSIAAERLNEELTKLVCGDHILPVLTEFGDVLGAFIPEILPCIGFDQKSRFHCYDVWEHSVRSMTHVAPQKHLRYHMMFHDLGKPLCFTEDQRGGHYYGHTEISAELAQKIMARLKFDNDTRRKVEILMKWHDVYFEPTEAAVRKVLSKIGAERLQDVLDAKRADNSAKRREGLERAQEPWNKAEEILHKLVEEDVCVTLKQLALDGRDMMRLGLAGKAVGEMLEKLLSAVIEGALPNEREALLTAARQEMMRKDN